MLDIRRVLRGMMATVGVLVLGSAAQGAFVPGSYLIDPGLSGETQYDGWEAIDGRSSLSAEFNPGLPPSNPFPGFPGTDPWPVSIVSKQGSAQHDAALSKVANGGPTEGVFPSGASLYFGGTTFPVPVNGQGATVAVTDPTPVSGLKNVVFQIEIGEQTGYDFHSHDLPVLSYNGGSPLAATYWKLLGQIDNGTYTPPEPGVGEQPIWINTYLLQWDLTDVPGSIADYSISFSAVQHAQVYAMRLDASDTFVLVPEPTSAGLLGATAGWMLLKRRRRV